jgi:hypothetical protein
MGEELAKRVSADAASCAKREAAYFEWRMVISSKSSAPQTRLDLFASLCLCIVDIDPKHGETLLQLLRPCPRPIFGPELGFHSTIHFEGVAGSGKLTGAATILFVLTCSDGALA